jgi:hypothetical protein
VTSNATERAELVKEKKYTELCAAIPNPSAFCVDGAIKDGRNGPFMVYNTSDVGVAVTPLHRCMATGKLHSHFISTDQQCEGEGRLEAVIGYGTVTPGLEMLRALRRCITAEGIRSHALDLACDTPDPAFPQVLAYVR